jgi:O6-methylguanine-DNA--protein-cysteine methyltransferase
MLAIAKQSLSNDNPVGVESAPVRVYWGCHDSPMGPIMLGICDNETLCKIAFSSGYGALYDLSEWKHEWPNTEFLPASSKTAPYACRISQMNPQNISPATFALYGASFQLRVLKAMLNLPQGEAMSFAELTRLVQKPKAA